MKIQTILNAIMGIHFEQMKGDDSKMVNGETCAKWLEARKKTHLDDQDEACYRCNGFDLQCGSYIPLSKIQQPFRRGAGAYALRKEDIPEGADA